MKKIFFLLVFCFLFSCEKKESNFSEEMIQKLSVMNEYKVGELLPSLYLGLDFYVLTKNNEVYEINNHESFFFYKECYFKKFKSFEDFLSAVLNKGFVLDKELFKKRIYIRQ